MDSSQLIHPLFVVLPLQCWQLEGGLLQGRDSGAPHHHPADNGNCASDWRGGRGEEEEMAGDGGGGGEQGVLVPGAVIVLLLLLIFIVAITVVLVPGKE